MIDKNNKNQNSKKFSYLPSDRIAPIPITTDQNYKKPKPPKKSFKTLGFISLFLFLLLTTTITVSLLLSQKKESKKAENTPVSTEIKNVDDDIAQIAPTINLSTEDSEVIFTIKDEQIFAKDFKSTALAFNPKLRNKQEVPEEEKIKYLKMLAENSIIIQAAENKNLINSTSQTFNNPNKDLKARSQLVRQAKRKLQEVVINTVSAETVSMFFHNLLTPPELNLEENKNTVKTKMDIIHQELSNNTLTMKEAGDLIINDSSQAEIDPAYEVNAYLLLESVSKQGYQHHDESITNALWSQKQGIISPVLTGRYKKPDGALDEAYFTIIKVNQRKDQGFDTFEDWLNHQKQNL